MAFPRGQLWLHQRLSFNQFEQDKRSALPFAWRPLRIAEPDTRACSTCTHDCTGAITTQAFDTASTIAWALLQGRFVAFWTHADFVSLRFACSARHANLNRSAPSRQSHLSAPLTLLPLHTTVRALAAIHAHHLHRSLTSTRRAFSASSR